MEHNNLVFEVDGLIYELIYNFKDAFQRESFEEKLVDVLKDKPYIVGDISHDKLRLSGFILTKDNNNPKNINDSQKCCETFEKIFKENTDKNYEKSEEKIYNILCKKGDENKAIQRAREKYHQVRKEYSQPSKMIGCTTVYKLVEELKKKIGKE